MNHLIYSPANGTSPWNSSTQSVELDRDTELNEPLDADADDLRKSNLPEHLLYSYLTRKYQCAVEKKVGGKRELYLLHTFCWREKKVVVVYEKKNNFSHVTDLIKKNFKK